MIVNRSQRWRDRRDHYVPASSEIDPTTLAVDVIDCMKTAKPWIEQHHYSGSFPASRLSLGLYQNGKGGRPAPGWRLYLLPAREQTHPFRSGPDSTAIVGRSTSGVSFSWTTSPATARPGSSLAL